MALQSRTPSFFSPRVQETSRGREVTVHRQGSARVGGLGGSWAAPVHLGAVSPALFDQSCISSLALRLQPERCAGKGLLWSPCQRVPGLAQTTMAVRSLAANCMFGRGRISPCSRTLSKGRKCLQAGWLPGLPEQLLRLSDSSKVYVITILPRLIWPLHDLPCGLVSPGRKNNYCTARWFHFFSGRLIS